MKEPAWWWMVTTALSLLGFAGVYWQVREARREARKRAAILAIRDLRDRVAAATNHDPGGAWENLFLAYDPDSGVDMNDAGRAMLEYMNALETVASRLKEEYPGRDDDYESLPGLIQPGIVTQDRIQRFREAEERGFTDGMKNRRSTTFEETSKLLMNPRCQFPKMRG